MSWRTGRDGIVNSFGLALHRGCGAGFMDAGLYLGLSAPQVVGGSNLRYVPDEAPSGGEAPYPLEPELG